MTDLLDQYQPAFHSNQSTRGVRADHPAPQHADHVRLLLRWAKRQGWW